MHGGARVLVPDPAALAAIARTTGQRDDLLPLLMPVARNGTLRHSAASRRSVWIARPVTDRLAEARRWGAWPYLSWCFATRAAAPELELLGRSRDASIRAG